MRVGGRFLDPSTLTRAERIVALVSLSVQSFTQDDAWLGFFVGVLLAGLLALGGATRRRERGAGWR